MKTTDVLLYLAAIAAATAVVLYVVQRQAAARVVRSDAWSADPLGLNNGGYGPGQIDWGV